MNFGLRLDEIFQTLNNKAREERTSCTERNNWDGYNSAYKRLEYEAKQAITSLIKELVADAKPKRAVIHYDELGIDRARKSAANSALDRFEQNLLKALEEV